MAQKVLKGIHNRTSIQPTPYIFLFGMLTSKGVYPPTCGRRSQIEGASRDVCQGAFSFGCGSVVVGGAIVDTGGGLPRLPAKGKLLRINLHAGQFQGQNGIQASFGFIKLQNISWVSVTFGSTTMCWNRER